MSHEYVVESELNPRVIDAMAIMAGALFALSEAERAGVLIGRMSDDGNSVDTILVMPQGNPAPEELLVAARDIVQSQVQTGASVMLAGALTTFYHQTKEGRANLPGALVLMEDRRRRYAEGYVVSENERFRIGPDNLAKKLVDDAFGHLFGDVKWPALF